MDIEPIRAQLAKFKAERKKVFATSSIQTQSVALLHIISRIDKSIPIFFINTGYLFPETIDYKDQIVAEFGLNIIDVKSFVPKNIQKDSMGNLLFTSDPDYCCYLNKIQPLDNILIENDVWINGIRADQSANRKEMNEIEKAPHNVLRYHPILNWTKQELYKYIKEHKLPRHPLDDKGYISIGCEPCTRKIQIGDSEREGRWFGMKKTECGLHTNLVIK